MTLQDWGICLTIVISTMSLLISIFNYWTSKPKLKIEITDKDWDCFFGKVLHEGTDIQHYIGGAQINIVNNSPVAITLKQLLPSSVYFSWILIAKAASYAYSVTSPSVVDDAN